MTYAVLTVVYDWCVAQFSAKGLYDGEATVSMEYLEALAELATAIEKVKKFN